MNKKMLKNTKFGRVLCRLVGEEAGATMMEYVILAVMIAAAVTAAAIYFGNTAKNQMNTAAVTMTGKTKEGETMADASQKAVTKEAASAHTSAAKFSKPGDALQQAK